MVFQLCYHQDGGSGLNLRREEVLDMTFSEAQFWLRKLGEQREEEAARIKSANKSKGK